MKHYTHTGRLLSLLTALALLLSLCTVPALAADEDTPAGSIVNTAEDGGADAISLSSARTFLATIPVDMTGEEAAAAAESVTWTLTRDESKPYLDKTLYPNQSQGGPLSGWVCDDGESPFFTEVTAAAGTVDGKTVLTAAFGNNLYFGDDPSTAQRNGGNFMDQCGSFYLNAVQDGQILGSAPIKIAPYDQFHTMTEIYAEIDAIVAYAKESTGLYVEKFSMGTSQGDNGLTGLDMPYLIVAKDRAAVDRWLAIKAQAESDPASLIKQLENGSLKDYQVPVLYSNIHANELAASDGILAFTWMLLNAAAGDGKLDYDRLSGFTAAGRAELNSQLGAAGKAGSVAVPDLVKDSATYLGYIRAEKGGDSAPVDLEKYYTIETETVDVDALLDDVFFLIVPEENVEGRTYMTRTSSGGFDLNRDNSFQTQAETQNMTRLIASWNPVSFTEFHGRVKTFQCEPCDPPHEPNFEYDLLAEHLMTGGEALGIAAVANNDGYNSYVIPQRDYLTYNGKTVDGKPQTQWLDPWDDMSTSYTPQYAMLHGTVAYTVEVPAHNDHVTTAVAYGQLGQSHYIAQNKADYLLAQTKILERGVTNANSNAYELVGQWFCDQYDVEGAEADLFRPVYDGEGQNGNFYPECYIIPLDGANQSNRQAAYDMVQYLTRNGVTVQLTGAFTYDGVDYPAGTAVVSMYQAKRSVANGVLYDGTVITEWPVLYSEGITAFNKTRGFDMAVCAEPEAYKTIRAAFEDALDYDACLDYMRHIPAAFTGVEDQLVVLKNDSEDAVAAVNALLKAGKSVSLITGGEYKGSFLCAYADWQSVNADYITSAVGIGDAPAAQTIAKAPLVYISGKPAANTEGFGNTTLVSGAYEYNYDRQAMELMGFSVTEDAAKADIIVGAAALDDAALAAVKSGTPYIGYGRRAIPSAAALFPEGALVRETAGENAMDALAYVTYPTETLINASYIAGGDDLLYGYGAGYFAAIPEGAKVLVQLDSSKGLLEGFLPSTGAHYKDFLNDSVQAISYQGKGADNADLNVVLFANTLTNKVHQRDEYAFVSNAAFASVLEGGSTGFTDVADGAWYTDAVLWAVDREITAGTSADAFSPDRTCTNAEILTFLWRAAGSPAPEGENPFANVSEDDFYCDAAAWAGEQGMVEGDSFAADAPCTRAMTAMYLWQASGSPESAGTASFTDVDASAAYAAAVDWAVEQGVTQGASGTTFAPGRTCTRAEIVTFLCRTFAE